MCCFCVLGDEIPLVFLNFKDIKNKEGSVRGLEGKADIEPLAFSDVMRLNNFLHDALVVEWETYGCATSEFGHEVDYDGENMTSWHCCF